MPAPPADQASLPSGRRSRGRLGTLLTVLVIAGLVWWFLRGVNLENMAAQIRRAQLPYVAAAIAVSLSGFLFRILRWRYLLAPVKWPRVVEAFAAGLSGAVRRGDAMRTLTPGRLRAAVAAQLGLTGMLAVSNDTAAGYAIVSHAVTLGPPTIIGLVIVLREGIALSSVTSWPAAGRSPAE